MRFAAALVAAASLASTHQPFHPRHCLYLKPRAELVCARKVLRVAKRGLHHPELTNHSESYWRWAEEVSRRGIRAARYRLPLPLTNDWQTAVRIVQRSWPGTAAWMLSCSAHEGGHGPFVMNTQGSGSGGWMQYLQSTFNSHYSHAVALARQRRAPIPPRQAASWTNPLGQAFAAGWGYHFNRSAWSGDPYC